MHVIHESYQDNYQRRHHQNNLNSSLLLLLIGIFVLIWGFLLGYNQKSIGEGFLLILTSLLLIYFGWDSYNYNERKVRRLKGFKR
jgi:Ca2+/Na+ antiporter